MFETPTNTRTRDAIRAAHDARSEALERCAVLDDHAVWQDALEQASRDGLDASPAGVSLRDLATDALRLSIRGLRNGAPCAGDGDEAARPLEALAERLGLPI